MAYKTYQKLKKQKKKDFERKMPPVKWYLNEKRAFNYEFKGINDPREFQEFDFEGGSKDIFGGVNMKTGVFKEVDYQFPEGDVVAEKVRRSWVNKDKNYAKYYYKKQRAR
jgi:hypothetical protein